MYVQFLKEKLGHNFVGKIDKFWDLVFKLVQKQGKIESKATGVMIYRQNWAVLWIFLIRAKITKMKRWKNWRLGNMGKIQELYEIVRAIFL